MILTNAKNHNFIKLTIKLKMGLSMLGESLGIYIGQRVAHVFRPLSTLL